MRRLVALVLLVGLTGACSFGGGSTSADYVRDDCTPRPREGHSVARVWDEALLHAIERDTPAPTVHARNLFHVSAAMWDAWAAYDPQADGWLVREKADADDAKAARETALSYAAYRLLLHRYSYASGLQETFDELVSTLEGLCYRLDYVETEGDSPAALGNRIAAAYIERGREDGANEPLRYADPTYKPSNSPLVVDDPGTKMSDPNSWQPLALARIVAQNGIPQPGSVQSFVGPHWGHVQAFALPASDAGVPIDPGAPPRLEGDAGRGYKRDALTVISRSAELDPRNGVTLDIGPGARGGNSLGANDGHGHDVNPATGKPYAPNVVLAGRLHPRAGRVLGGRPALRDPARALELRRERDLRLTGARAEDRRARPGGRPPGVGRQALPRAQRRRPRRRRRRLGPEGALRLGPADLDDPLPRRAEPAAERARPRRAS